ncbi:hypothetical protein [Brevundimonas sp.]|uniref:hypothetical protein n=1 Tax=Brevundimonas sp. TaxID=1871086 RepID=UPI0035B2CD29
MNSMIGVIAFATAIIVSLSAILVGGRPRPVGIVILLGWTATLLVSRQTEVHRVQEGVLIVDSLALVALAALYIVRPSWWRLIMAGAQVNAVLSHVVIGLGTGMVGYAYGSAVWLLGILQLAPLTIAVFQTWRSARAA